MCLFSEKQQKYAIFGYFRPILSIFYEIATYFEIDNIFWIVSFTVVLESFSTLSTANKLYESVELNSEVQARMSEKTTVNFFWKMVPIEKMTL